MDTSSVQPQGSVGCELVGIASLFPRSAIRRIFGIPLGLKGRIGAIRFQTKQLDVCFIVGYAPPEPSDIQKLPNLKCYIG